MKDTPLPSKEYWFLECKLHGNVNRIRFEDKEQINDGAKKLTCSVLTTKKALGTEPMKCTCVIRRGLDDPNFKDAVGVNPFRDPVYI